MDGKRFALKYLTWPHSLWIGFVIGILVAWIATHFLDPSDRFLTKQGEQIMILAWGFLCASGSTHDLPNHDADRQAKTSAFRTRIRRLFYGIFFCLMMYAWIFQEALPETNRANKPEISSPITLRVD